MEVRSQLSDIGIDGNSASERLHSRVKRKIDLIDKIASDRRISAKLVKAEVRRDGLVMDESSHWIKKYMKKLHSVHETIKERITYLYPTIQANRQQGKIHTQEFSGVEARLARHGNPTFVANEVVSISAQRLPRNTIVKHLRGKFPNLQNGEINDIIAASHVHLGKPIPLLSDMHEQDRLANIQKEEHSKSDNNHAPPEWFRAKD
jgi:hypothetical protein